MKVRYVADTMDEAMTAARRSHGAGARILRAGACRDGSSPGRIAFEVVVEAALRTAHARRQARQALAQAVLAARLAAAEAGGTVAAAPSGAAVAAVLARLGARLRAQALDEDLVGMVLARVTEELEGAAADEIDALGRAAAMGAVAALLPVSQVAEPRSADVAGRPWVVAVASPTGVGKTTTVAKLAAEWRINRGLRVGLLAADGFRVGAVEQLRTYGAIIGAPVRAADGREAARDALAALSSCDVVLVDTPGRGHRDRGRIAEVAEVVSAVRPDETCLVLPGCSSARALDESVAAFAPLGASRLVLTKLDETEGLGSVLGAARRSGTPAAWFTAGQDVPDDIEAADGASFARRMLGEGSDLGEGG